MSKPFFTREFSSTIEAITPVVAEALDTLVERGWFERDGTFHAHLCLEEALVNAIKHGNGGESDRTVRLEMSEEPAELVIRVSDEGKGFCVNNVELPDVDEPGGRGICLIRHCMDEVKYDRDNRCLVMKLRRNALSRGAMNHE